MRTLADGVGMYGDVATSLRKYNHLKKKSSVGLKMVPKF